MKTVLATNTSSFPVREVATATGRPYRVVGLRWRVGPFELMNRTGLAEAVRLARAV